MRRALAILTALSLTLTLVASGPATADTDWQAKVDAAVLEAAASGQTEFIAYLAAKTDLSAASRLTTKEAKGWFVYDALTTTARTSQAGLVSLLRSLGAPYQQFWISNALVVSGGTSVLQAVASRSEVQAVFPLGKGEVYPPVAVPTGTESVDVASAVGPSLAHVNADDAWALGITGQGIVVGGMDTGFQWDHPALKPHYRGWDGGSASHDYNWHDAIHAGGGFCGGDSTAPCDVYGHGTHIMGTAVGDDNGGNQIGMAPGAKWIGCRNMDNSGDGTPASYLECFEFMLAPYPVGGAPADGNPDLAPDVTNNSWGCVPTEGCTGGDLHILEGVLEAQRAAGILTVASAGNGGSGRNSPCGSSPPRIGAHAIGGRLRGAPK